MKPRPGIFWKCLYCGKSLHDMWERCGCPGDVKAEKRYRTFLLVVVLGLVVIALAGWIFG